MSPVLPHALIRVGITSGLALSLIAGTAAVAAAAQQEPGMASQFVATINAERAANGRPALATSSALTSAAARWASTMASRNVLSHNPNLAGEVSGWHYLGENVGVGPSVSSLANAFWESPEHRSNILDPHYTRVGVAVVDVGGKLWVAEEFERPYGATSAPATRPAAPKHVMAEVVRTGARVTLRHPAGRAAPALSTVAQPDRCPRTM